MSLPLGSALEHYDPAAATSWLREAAGLRSSQQASGVGAAHDARHELPLRFAWSGFYACLFALCAGCAIYLLQEPSAPSPGW